MLMQATTPPPRPLLDPDLLHRPEAVVPFCIALVALLTVIGVAWARHRHRKRLRGYRTLSPLELEEMLQGPPPILVDVRSREAPRTGGHIKSTLHIPRAELKDHMDEFARRDSNNRVRTIVLVDEEDEEPQKAARFLMDQKVPFVYVLYGGLKAWRRRGLPLVK